MSKKDILSWTLVIGWMIVIFVLSHQDATQSTLTSGKIEKLLRLLIININEDKWLENVLVQHIRTLAHFGVYLVLGLLLANAIGLESTMLAIGIGLLYAISDEIHQYFIPGRAFQVFDVTIDLLGVIVGVMVYRVVDKLVIIKS